MLEAETAERSAAAIASWASAVMAMRIMRPAPAWARAVASTSEGCQGRAGCDRTGSAGSDNGDNLYSLRIAPSRPVDLSGANAVKDVVSTHLLF